MSDAFGNKLSPYLFVMLSQPSDKMMNWFWKKLLSVGIQKADVRIVYLLDSPPAGAGGKPTKAQTRESFPRFRSEIVESRPQVILPMGAEAMYQLTGIRLPIFDTRGYIIQSDLFRPVETDEFVQYGTYQTSNKTRGIKKGDPKMKWEKRASGPLCDELPAVPVIPLFNLEHIRIEGFTLSPVMKEDLLRAKRAVDGTLQPVDAGFTYCKTVNDFNLVDKFPMSDMIAVDIETHGVDNEVIDLVSFSDGVTSASLEWSPEVRDLMSWMFSINGVYFALHNSPFDLPRLRANGVNIPDSVVESKVFDTMFGAVIIQPDLHKSLGRVTSLYLDTHPWKWRVLSSADPRRYSALDAFHTSLLAQRQRLVMEKIGCWDLFMGGPEFPGPGEMATIPTLTRMSREGIPINTEYVIGWAPKLQRKMFRYQALWTKHFPETKASSTKSLQKLFYGEWGLPVQRTREDGISTDELALVSLRAYVEANRHLPGGEEWKTDPRCNSRTFDLLLKMRDTNKMYGTYVAPIADSGNRSVHPQYLPVSKDEEKGAGKSMSSKGNTATGRLASFNPNIQNQPKKARVLYVPDDPSHCFIQADYKSAELYVMAWSAGDKKLLEDLKGDMHQRNADRLGVSRKTAKNVTYASQYLAGPSKQSEMILKQEHMYVSPAECLRVANGIWGYYDRVTAYKEHLVNLCKTQRYIKNAFGRIRFFHANEAPAAVDFIPQSTVADVLWCVLKPVSDMVRAYGGRMYTTVHDSILVAVPEHARDTVAKKMKQIMEKRFNNVAPGFYIPVEVEAAGPGEPWSAVKPLHLEDERGTE